MWAGCLVDWRIGNSAFQLSVAKSRSRADRLNDIIRDIMYLQLKYGFVLSTSWIASEDNILPDDLSRDPASGHGEAAFLAAQDTLAEFLAPGAVLQRHPQAGRVVTFADHAHLARELREGASDGRWAAAPLSPPPSPPAMEVGGAPLRLISRAEEREALERAWAEAEAEAAEAELAQQHFARSVAVAEGLATPDSRRALPPTPDAPVREAPTPLRMVREGGADVSPAGAARRRGPTPSSFLPYVSSFEHSSSTSRVGGSLAQQLSVPYARANLFDGLPVEYMERVDQVLDNRLAASSMAKIATAHKRLAAWVVSMMDDTALVFSSISSYVWCIRTWHRLQHQADPVMGVMDWTSFFTGIAVYTAVPAEPREEVPLEVVRQILGRLDPTDFDDVASVGRERRSTPRPRCSSSSGTPSRRVQFVADVAAELQSVSLDDGQPLAAAPVAAQQVDRLEDAITYWDRGTSSRRPPTERHR